MVVKNIKDVNAFFDVVNKCKGRVELVTDEGDVLNLRSKLTQFVSLSNIFSNDDIGDLELVCSDKEDIERLMHFMING